MSCPARLYINVDEVGQLVKVSATKQPKFHNHTLDHMDRPQFIVGLRAVMSCILKTGVVAADVGVILKDQPDRRQRDRLRDAGGQFPRTHDARDLPDSLDRQEKT